MTSRQPRQGPASDDSARAGDAAAWIIRRLHAAQDVGALVPEGFEAYARILHPAVRVEEGPHARVRWRDVARRAGRRLEPTIRFDTLSPEGMCDLEPLAGSLECDELAALLQLLAHATRQPDECWFAVWEGYGWMRGPPAVAELRPLGTRPPDQGQVELPAPVAGRVEIADRPLVLFRGPLAMTAKFCSEPFGQTPNLWWPAERAWCIASEIDFHSTYVGGTDALIDAVVRDTRLEALRVQINAPVTD